MVNLSPISPTYSDAKKAEIARLYELFAKLSSRQTRQIDSIITKQNAPIDKLTCNASWRHRKTMSTLDGNTTTQKLPDDTTTSVGTNCTKSLVSKPSTRPRRNTVASILSKDINELHHPLDEDDGSDDESIDVKSLAIFPLAKEKKYQFTFKHMVHKLYKKDDFVKAVKEMLEKSKNEFKPLAEQLRDDEVIYGGGGKDSPKKSENRFKVVYASGGAHASGKGSRQRSHSVAGTGIKHSSVPPLSPTLKSPRGGSLNKVESRALKKRCIGRRKSMSGPLNAGSGASNDEKFRGPTTGTWVYNAAVSSCEPAIPATVKSFPPVPPPSPIGGAHATGQYQPLALMNVSGRISTSVEGQRKVSFGSAPVKETPLLLPLNQVTNTNTEGLAARRRKVQVSQMDEEKNNVKKPAKRPLNP